MVLRVRLLKASLSLLNALRKSCKQYNVEEKNFLFLTIGATYKEGLVQHNLEKGKYTPNCFQKDSSRMLTQDEVTLLERNLRITLRRRPKNVVCRMKKLRMASTKTCCLEVFSVIALQHSEETIIGSGQLQNTKLGMLSYTVPTLYVRFISIFFCFITISDTETPDSRFHHKL